VLRSFQVALINPADKKPSEKDEQMVKEKKISGVQDVGLRFLPPSPPRSH
jgi:hypothetical protein